MTVVLFFVFDWRRCRKVGAHRAPARGENEPCIFIFTCIFQFIRLILVRRLGSHNMPRATFRFYPGIPGWVDSDALSDSHSCTRIGAKPHEYKKKTGGLSCPKFGW